LGVHAVRAVVGLLDLNVEIVTVTYPGNGAEDDAGGARAQGDFPGRRRVDYRVGRAAHLGKEIAYLCRIQNVERGGLVELMTKELG
jgi:hypothetical protein